MSSGLWRAKIDACECVVTIAISLGFDGVKLLVTLGGPNAGQPGVAKRETLPCRGELLPLAREEDPLRRGLREEVLFDPGSLI